MIRNDRSAINASIATSARRARTSAEVTPLDPARARGEAGRLTRSDGSGGRRGRRENEETTPISAPRRVLREALFTRDAARARQQIEDLDNRMRDLLALHGWDARTARAEAVAYLQAHLDRLSPIRTAT